MSTDKKTVDFTPSEARRLSDELRAFIRHHGRRQRLAKEARRTRRTPQDRREHLLKELGLDDELADIQSFVDERRHWLTVAHVLYGDLRHRPHPVADPDSYRRQKHFFLDYILIH